MIQVTVKDVNTGEELFFKGLEYIPEIDHEVTIFKPYPDKAEDAKRYKVVGVSHSLSKDAKHIVNLLVTPIIEPVNDKDNG